MRKAAIILGAFLLVMTAGCGSRSHVSAVSVSGNGDLQQAQAQAQVEPQLRAELAAELKRVLLLYPPRAVSAPPSGSASATVLSWDEGAGSFQWRYYSAGDYDQNGEVGVSDLTPLGVHFGKSTGGGPFDPSTVESVVDGDQNGLIGVSDVTPIGQHFGIRCQGYRLYFSTDEADVPQSAVEANGSGAELVAELALSAATGTPAQRKQFSYAPEEAPPEGYYWVRPYDDDQQGTPSNAWLLGSTNQPPIAVLRAAPTSGLVPLTVELLGIFSADLDGEIVKYEWDFDGPINGEEWLDTEDQGYAEYTYDEAGAYLATMRVTDDLGEADTASELIRVREPTPPVAALEYDQEGASTPSHVIFDASGSTDDDGLIVQYEWDFDDDGIYDYDGGAESTADFYYWELGTFSTTVRVTDEDGLSSTASDSVLVTTGAEWHVTTVRDDTYGSAPSPLFARLREVVWKPAILFSHREGEEPEQLHYVRAEDEEGQSWGESLALGPELGGSSLPSLTIVDGNPALVRERYYCRATDPLGASWLDPVLIDENADISELLVINDQPVAVGQSGYYVSQDSTGETWTEASSLRNYSLDADRLSAAIVAGLPGLAARDSSILFYTSAYDSSGESWRLPVLAASAGGSGSVGGTRLIDADGHPAIVHLNSLAVTTVEYVRALNPEGTAWGPPVILARFITGAPDMTVLDGRPAVVYTDKDTLHLYFTAANDNVGGSWSTPIAIEPTASEGQSVANPLELSVVNGKPAVAYRAGVSGPGTRLLLKYAIYR